MGKDPKGLFSAIEAMNANGSSEDFEHLLGEKTLRVSYAPSSFGGAVGP